MNVKMVVHMRFIVAITILVAVLPLMTVTVFRLRFQGLAAGQAKEQ
jgi:surface polysaccharide O-acyltransferase-like enzyme